MASDREAEFNVTDYLMSRWSDPTATAFVTSTGSYHYSDLVDLVDRQMVLMQEAGVRRGGRVVIVAGNTIGFVVSLLATMRLEAMAVPLSPDEPSGRIARVVDVMRPSLVISVRAMSGLPGETDGANRPMIVGADTLFTSTRRTDPTDPTFDRMACDGVVSVQFTSGSTSEPKGVLHTAEGMRQTIFGAAHLADHVGQKLFLGLPLCYSYGGTQLLEFLSAAATIVLADRFGLPDDLWRQLDGHGITVLEGPPAIHDLLSRSSRLKAQGLPRLKRLGMAGGRIPRKLPQKLWRLLPGCTITNRYGVTEISGGLCRTVLSEAQLARGPVPCGRPFPWVRIDVLAEDGSPQKLGVPGDLVIESPGMMWGYFPDRMTQPRFRTADVGYFDCEGELVLTGRKSEMIKRNGVRITPAEIEHALLEDPSVKECIVFGVDDDDQARERVFAIVVPSTPGEPPDPRALYATCRLRLPRGQLPDRIVVLSEIPLAGTGKPDYAAVRRCIEGLKAEGQESDIR